MIPVNEHKSQALSHEAMFSSETEFETYPFLCTGQIVLQIFQTEKSFLGC